MTGPTAPPAPPAPTGALFDVYLLLTREGLHAREVARRLGKPHRTIQRIVARLLMQGAIATNTPPVSSGPIRYVKGPNAHHVLAGAPGAGGPGVAPPAKGLVIVPHRGTLRFHAPSLPPNPDRLPGLTKHRAPSGAPCWWYTWPDTKGNTWRAQLNGRKDGTATVLVTPPTAWTRDLGPALDATAWREATKREATRWGHEAGLVLDADTAQVQPREYAMPGMGVGPAGQAGHSKAWSDPTPTPGTIETQDEAIVRHVATLPEDQAEQDRRLRQLESNAHVMERNFGRVVGVLEAHDRLAKRNLDATLATASILQRTTEGYA